MEVLDYGRNRRILTRTKKLIFAVSNLGPNNPPLELRSLNRIINIMEKEIVVGDRY